MEKQYLKHITTDLQRIGRLFTYLLIFFYLAQLIWPYIELPYSNPLESHGLLTQIRFNPANNLIRFLMLLSLTVFGPTLTSLLTNKLQKPLVRTIFILLIVISYFFIALAPQIKNPRVDFLHDGERLSNAVLFLRGKRLYSELFFLHGAFLDPIIAVISFFIFGRAIGSYQLLTGLLLLFSLLMFYILLAVVINNDLIFYLASLWFFNFISGSNDLALVNFSVSNIRDITVWIVLMLLWLLLKKPLLARKCLIVIGFLSGFQYYISYDRAYFLTFLTFFLAVIFPFFTSKNIPDKRYLQYVYGYNKKQVKTSLSLLAAFILGFFIHLPIVGFKSFGEFLKIAFWQLPRMVGNFHEQKFLLISEHSSLVRGLVFWLPIFLIILNGLFIVNKIILPFIEQVIIKKKSYLVNFKNIYLVIIYVFSIVFFRGALVTVGLYHLNYGSSITFLITFIIADQYFSKTKTYFQNKDGYLTVKYFLTLSLILIVLFNYNLPINYEVRQLSWGSYPCTFHPQKEEYNWFAAYFGSLLFCPPYQKLDTIKQFLTMPKIIDNNWIPEPTQKTISFINNNTTEDDYVFVFSNESIYYYFLKAKSPTRFAGIWFADTNVFRQEALADLKKHQPKFVVYSSGSSPEIQEDVSMAVRFSDIDKWILENYPNKIKFDKILVLAK